MSRRRRRRRDRKGHQKGDAGQVELLPEMVEQEDESAAPERTDEQVEPADQNEGQGDPLVEVERIDREDFDPEVMTASAGNDSEVVEGDHQDPRPAGNQLARARDLVESGRVQEAVQLYRDILADNPMNMKAHNNVGVLFDELGEHETAVQHFEAALEVEDRNVEVLTNHGVALTELGRYEEADEVLRKAERLDPGELRTRLAIGILAFRRGLYEDAEMELRSICDRVADHGPAHYYRGEALNRLGRFDAAAEVMARAAELLPHDPRPAYTLGHLYDRQGLPAEAAQMYRRARDLQSEATW